MWIYVIISIIFLIIIYVFTLYNNFVKLKNKVKEAFATMDVYLKKRWDLIPNIVETVKEYAKHEKDTLKEVLELRNGSYNKMSDDKEIKTNEQLSSSINKIMALAEAYPDLNASENFKDLSNQLVKIEDDIANSRKYYNGVGGITVVVMQDCTYFYNILPYTYVLGVSDKWIKMLESISMQASSWYDSPYIFDVVAFGTFMNFTMASE